MLFDGLTVLQHRGQDAAGIVTAERRRLHLRQRPGQGRFSNTTWSNSAATWDWSLLVSHGRYEQLR
jgi:glutamine phosphoribosylpyrophosphate amidotransferase